MKEAQRGSARGTAVILGLVVVCVVILVLRSLRSEPSEEVSEPSQPTAQISSSPALSDEAPVARLDPSATANPKQAETLSVPCKDFLQGLKDLDVKALARTTSLAVEFPVPTECATSGVSEELAAALGKYKMSCDAIEAFANDRLTDEEARKRNQSCLLSLLTLRAQLGAAEIAAIASQNLSDPKQLEDRLVHALTKGDVNQTLEAARRLLEIEPRHQGASRALMNSYIKLASEYNGTRRDPFWRDVRQAVRTGMRSGGLDPEEVIRTRLYSDYLQYKNAARLMRLSDASAAQFPNAAAPYLFKAIAAFERNRKPEAIGYLQEYGRRSKDPESNATIARIQAGHTQPFQVSFSTEVDLLSVQAD